MLPQSSSPTRLLVRCTSCRSEHTINRDEYIKHPQVFCDPCGLPMVVFGVIAGAIAPPVHKLVIVKRASTPTDHAPASSDVGALACCGS